MTVDNGARGRPDDVAHCRPRDGNMANIKVAVRVRPISIRELSSTGTGVMLRTESNEISLTNLKVSSSKAGDSRERTRRYGFDYCFDSSDPEAKNYADQATIYETLGQSILDTMFAGYNGCLVAYGQSASGKTYTMMGTKEDPGLIPRLCEGILSRVEQENGHERVYRVTVSYLEIYNERVRDLLKPSTSASGLRVREHPRLGPYVQGLTRHVVHTLGSLMSYVEEGTKARKTASTLQNPSSSRSHALLTVDLSQETSETERSGGGDNTNSSSRRQDTNPRNGGGGGGSSRLHLVDLAGSESAATCGGVHRLKEGANINKSLMALGNVISALAERGSTGSGPGKRYIPYRDSSLTWLLKDALGGNATTIMLATISPASGSYNETAHTLRFAQRAQSVVNRPVVNEDPVARLIRELRAEVARLKSLLSEKDIETKVPCCCGKAQASTDPEEDHEEQESLGTNELKDEFELSKSINPRPFEVFPIRRFNSSDSVTTCETGSSGSIRKFNSCEHLQSPDRFAGSYNQAKVTEIDDEEDEVVDEINEPVFVDIPTLVAVLIKPDDSLHESSAQIEEICSDEVQEDSIDVDFIEAGNEEYEEPTTKLDDDERSNSTSNSCNIPDDQEINELHRVFSICSPSKSAEKGKPRGKFSKQNSIDLPSSNLNVSRKFGSIDGISKSKEPALALQRSQTNLEKRPTLPERGKKLNNIREIDDRKTSGKSGVWKAIGNVNGSRDHLQRKSSNESDKSLKESISGKAAGHSIGRKPSLESLKRKTSKDSSSSSSKEEQILISSLARDKLLRRKDSFDHEAGGARQHTTIQRVKRAEIVAAVTERLYSSRKYTEESTMASNSASGTRSPPEGTDVKAASMSSSSSSLIARSRLQEISRKMLLRRRRINVETQTEAASTLRFRDAASLTEEPKVVLQDAAVLTDDHADYVMQDTVVADHRVPVLRVKDAATLTDRRPRAEVFRCKDAESLVNDLDFDECEPHSPRNDSGVLSDDTQNYGESNLSSAEVLEHLCHQESDRRVLYADSSTNTFLTSPTRNSAVQTTRPEVPVDQRKANPESRSCSGCCSLTHEAGQRAPASSPERNVISISLPDMISITIESTNGLESRIAVVDGTTDIVEEKPKLVLHDKESQTDEHVRSETEKSSLTDLALRSTATQADGRVFRIENIFEDPKSKSCHEATSGLRREVATKKSVTFRNSLGTSSAIGTKETGTETDWDGVHVEDVYHRKRAILRGGLTRAFIAKRRSCSSSPRRPAHRLVRHNLWKNWTLPRPERSPGLVDYGRETRSVLFPAQRDTNLGLIDSLSSRMSIEYTSADKIAREPSRESSNGSSRSDLKKTKVAATKKSSLEHDHNFSDDSLDEDNVARKSADAETTNSHDRESHENLCPPDVVAHTKREASKSTNHMDLADAESSMDDDFDDTNVELPRRKSTEISNKDPIQDYKALILGISSYVINSDSEEETNAMTTSDISISKKKVSFSDPSSPEEITDHLMINHKILAPKQVSEIALKSIIKKMMKPPVAESLDIVRPNVEIDQSSQQKKIKSIKSEEMPSTNRENQDSADSKKQFDDKRMKFPDEDRSEESHGKTDSIISSSHGTTCSHPTPKRSILEEYLNQATTFMRNMNSMNEYMSATSVLESYYGKHSRRKRGGARRGNNLGASKDSTSEFRGWRASPRDDADPPESSQNGTAAVESYEKCLKSIERLEACIDRVGRHNQVLRDRYGIDVESAGAKSSLACSSVDSRMPVVIDDSVVIRPRGNDAGNDAEDRDEIEPRLSRISSPSLSSSRADDARRFAFNETDRRKTVPKLDDDHDDDDDLERRIFDQLMCAADSSCRYWSLRKPARQRRLWKSDLRSRSPTTYSKLRETLRRNGRGILNFDEVSAAGDYLGDTRGIESSRRDHRKTKSSDLTEEETADSRISSIASVDPERFRDELLQEDDDDSLEMKLPRESAIFRTRMEHLGLADPVRSIGADRTTFAEEEIARRDTQGSKDSLRLESMNLRFGGPLSVELKYPGSPRAKFLELLRERRRIVENSRGTNAF